LSTRIKDLEEFNTFLDNNLKIAKRENSNLKKEMKTIKDLLKKKEKKILNIKIAFLGK
jgi:predicted  nucleic acid-binding Zn-ribbon protein